MSAPDTNEAEVSALPYVVSADVRLLLEGWAKTADFKMPEERFFEELREEFSTYMKKIFPSFEFLHENTILAEMQELMKECGLPIVSLDRAYWHSNLAIELSRNVGTDMSDLGLAPRSGTPSLEQQVSFIASQAVEVVLVDDVIFSGDLIESVITSLKRCGVGVRAVYAAVGVANGVNRVQQHVEKVRCIRLYRAVRDEVCERDFYPGVPFSGRSLVGGDNVGLPYVLPFGNPVEWASIPQDCVDDFSRFCIRQTRTLFREIGRVSEREVRCCDLPRKVHKISSSNKRFVDVLS
ncbi:hypothetical protein A3D66_01240 [Candidatus Kaiserbacteria bacterium RIFCSPHIGHO2_02_FULL_50_9]|uniref:Phosphoribosyltransferase domain-containing protein n=1 Tax=Candidatus Kaiserbacteria bacterium RIFCSPLOWO2_01_FULL_51_21 TaxID=1798508 RepID=A0A1F6EDQ5_9BACT|nr:MAG: hypothetical protein A2761_01520 [Candidatus Kaiserbacteria bacterium RIFCSPHIGHO2_01_FULL_51_33]OGG63520.1 MAG: hypothetical protein A3D66_01240 [Candidatus Kaiserbacteria bacterium RIFCSPHIGHO2_02_FULL_50_9]OGG71786.1 MAG: hypothetical protein A3A35_02600 [Candidatus Kaiserbacteria bacterium RIFCSPLOWO2_01_FULL_51_21]